MPKANGKGKGTKRKSPESLLKKTGSGLLKKAGSGLLKHRRRTEKIARKTK